VGELSFAGFVGGLRLKLSILPELVFGLVERESRGLLDGRGGTHSKSLASSFSAGSMMRVELREAEARLKGFTVITGTTAGSAGGEGGRRAATGGGSTTMGSGSGSAARTSAPVKGTSTRCSGGGVEASKLQQP
jgi:hypothetical protein